MGRPLCYHCGKSGAAIWRILVLGVSGIRVFWLLAACLCFGGCAAPPAYTFFSFGLDGASIIATGKTVSDHALSAAVEKDCAMWRLLGEQDIKAVCREYAHESETAITVAANRPASHPATYTIAATKVSPSPGSRVYATASENLFLGTDPAKAPTETAAAEPETGPPSETVAATSEPVASAKPVTGGGRFGVQLAAYRMRHGAEVEWEMLRSAHPDLLGGLNATLQPADLGAEKGVVHRLVVGSFETKVTARAFCAQLKQRNVDCFVQRS